MDIDLFERAKNRRLLASLALHRFAGAKIEKTAKELQEALNKVDHLQSIFGAPKTSQGEPVGKAGRTVALIEAWLKSKESQGLPPVGSAFEAFVRGEMDRAKFLYGHDELIDDTARDIKYNFGFDPREIELVDVKIPAPVAQEANMVKMPQIVSSVKPFVKSQVRAFTKSAGAYEPSKKDDHTVIDPVPVVTRVDYEENIQKAKEKSQFPKQPIWNKRNTAVNDLLHDLSSKDYEKKDSDVVKGDEALVHDKSKPYPKKEASVKGFVKKKVIKAKVSVKNGPHFYDLLEAAVVPATHRLSATISELESRGVDIITVMERHFFPELEKEEQQLILTAAKLQLPVDVFKALIERVDQWVDLPLKDIKQVVDSTFNEIRKALLDEYSKGIASPWLASVVGHYNELSHELDSMFVGALAPEHRGSIVRPFVKQAGLYATPIQQTSNCPDHPTVRMARVADADATYCCPIDGKKYDFLNGFTKANGERMNGSSIAEQIPDFIGHLY